MDSSIISPISNLSDEGQAAYIDLIIEDLMIICKEIIMTEEKQEKIMYFATCGGENPEKACLPFVLGIAALAMDINAMIVLQGNGVYLTQPGYRKTMLPGGAFPKIDKLLEDFLSLGGELHVCMPCIKERNIDESELPEGAKITAAGQINLAAIEADALFVY
jgi:uncharacterized protein involved in oxidation of intracellular sulfur